MTTVQEGDGSGVPAPLTQADIPAVVQAVAEALKDQLKEQRPPPPADGNREPADPGEGTSARTSKLLLQSASAVGTSGNSQHLAR